MMHGREKSEIDLVDHDDVNLSGAYIVQQPLQIGTVGGPPGVPTVIVPGPDQGPARMGLTPDIGRGSIVLGIQ